jgi:hypothetical protein
MEGRGERARKETKLGILDALIENACGILELSRITDTARATVSTLVHELEEVSLLERTGERSLGINSNIVMVFMEIYRDYTEVLSYYFKDGRCDRVQIRHTWSLSFEGNLERSVVTLSRHVRQLKESGYSVYTAAMFVNCSSRKNIPTNAFDAVAKRSEMISEYWRRSGRYECLLYVDENDMSADLYCDGKHICGGVSRLNDIQSDVERFLAVLHPTVLVLECKKTHGAEDFEGLKNMCASSRLELVFIEKNKPTPAELALMLAAFEKHL